MNTRQDRYRFIMFRKTTSQGFWRGVDLWFVGSVFFGLVWLFGVCAFSFLVLFLFVCLGFGFHVCGFLCLPASEHVIV